MSFKHTSPLLRPLLWALGLSMCLSLGLVYLNALGPTPEETSRISRERIATALQPSIDQGSFPTQLHIPLGPGEPLDLAPIYTVDWELQGKMEKLFKQYRPDHGAFVAVDAETGRILSLVSYSANDRNLGNMALRSSYPAASLFKIVTAAAVIDSGKARADTRILFNGGYHTLYRRNVNSKLQNRWTREMTIKEAFAKSVNTVFAKIGLFLLDPTDFRQYAKRFRFNEAIASDVKTSSGRFMIPASNEWAMAEIASGFNRYVTLSPLQGAMMAGAIANDGVLMEPYLIDKLTTIEGETVYQGEPMPASYAMSKEAAFALRQMMQETVSSGTSRKSFRTLRKRKNLPDVEIGGKTGSLTGTDPVGKYDWFVGYATIGGKRKIAMTALTINEKTWKVKSSYVARHYIENYLARLSRSVAGAQ